MPKVEELLNLTQEFCEVRSPYRGKAIRIESFPQNIMEVLDAGPEYCPTFLDTSGVNTDELVFSDDVYDQVRTSILTPILYTQECRDNQIPLKRGVLLEGAYGTGKTMTAYVTAKYAERHGWTFLYLGNVEQLPEAINFAKRYSPCVIFAEDIDQVLSSDEADDRTEETNRILNTIDGVDSKNSEIMVVLSTNHVDHINPAMLRPGRLDAVISVDPPDARAVERLIRQYARGLVDDAEDLTGVGRLLQGNIPATIREVVERSKLAAVHRSQGKSSTIQAEDLEVAAKGMLKHLNLLRSKSEERNEELEVRITRLENEGRIEAARIIAGNSSNGHSNYSLPALEAVE